MLAFFLLLAADAPDFRTMDRDAAGGCYETVTLSPAEQSAVFLRYAGAIRLARADAEKPRAEAARVLEQLAREAPWLIGTHRALAVVQAARGQWLAAYAAYKRYLHFDLHPSDREASRAALAELEHKLPALERFANAERAAVKRAYSDAARMAEEVVADKPSFAPAHRLLGIAYAATARPEDAVAAYERYLKLDALAVDGAAVQAIIDQTRQALRARDAKK